MRMSTSVAFSLANVFLLPSLGDRPQSLLLRLAHPLFATSVSVSMALIKFGGCYLAPQCGGTPDFTRPLVHLLCTNMQPQHLGRQGKRVWHDVWRVLSLTRM